MNAINKVLLFYGQLELYTISSINVYYKIKHNALLYNSVYNYFSRISSRLVKPTVTGLRFQINYTN